MPQTGLLEFLADNGIAVSSFHLLKLIAIQLTPDDPTAILGDLIIILTRRISTNKTLPENGPLFLSDWTKALKSIAWDRQKGKAENWC